MANLGICRFCEKEKKLIEAHIIPLSFYRPFMENEVPRLYSKTGDPKDNRKAPKGEYDKNLVCNDCELRFSPYDDYAKRFLVDDYERNKKIPEEFNEEWAIIDSYDYPKLKLFFISLLWRASATTRLVFEKINVGPYEQRLKEMIFKSDPGSPNEFPVMLKKFKEDWADKGIIQPTRFKSDGLNCYHFFLGGFCARIKVDSKPYPQEFEVAILKPDSPLYIAQQEITDSYEMKSFMKEHIKNLDKTGF